MKKALNSTPQKLPKYRVRVGYQQTINEIQTRLIKAGAKKIVFDYEGELPISITFSYPFKGELIFFSLPIRFNGIIKLMKIQKIAGDDEHAINMGWRIMKDWIVAQLALVDSEVAELPEVFLPYAITNNGDNLYDFIKGDSQILQLK